MKLKSFGCSFIFGSELADDGQHTPYAKGSQLTWPALLAQKLGYEYECAARPGAGNLEIAEKVLNSQTNVEPALYVVGWTWIDRFSYISARSEMWKNSSKWSTIMPVDTDDLAKVYYKELHSEYRDKLTTLMNIKLTIDTLKQKNLPFIMTNMDGLIFDSRWNTSSAVNELQDYIRPHITQFDGLSFLDWSKKHHYPIGVAAHPLEQAHAAAAEYISELGVHKV